MVTTAVECDAGVVVLPFNGWLFEGYEDAKTALMGTILEELIDQQKLLPQTLATAKHLLSRVDLFKFAWGVGKLVMAAHIGGPAGALAGTSGGLDIGEAAAKIAAKAKDLKPEEVEKWIKANKDADHLRRSIRSFRSEFGRLLEDSKIGTLVVVIDDLDRCLPDTIIETLEAIKLFLFVPRTAFIVGADERLVKYAVRKRFPELPGERFEVGRDYLEKLVQFPVRIPPLGRAEMETYINLLFARLSGLSPDEFEKARTCVVNCDPAALTTVNFNLEVAQRLFGKVSEDLAESLALAQRIAPVLAAGLNGNPRQCKRFLNTLLMRLAMARSRGVSLEQRVLAKLMLLEYFRPESFRRLAELQAAEGGKPRVMALLEGQSAAPPTPEETEESDLADAPSGRTAHRRHESRRKQMSQPESDVKEPLPPEFHNWISEPWLKDWLALEPALAAVDLAPYFFFSRDTLASLGGYSQRMTAAAERTLQELLYESQAVRTVALKKAETLSAAEAAGVFEALTARLQKDEDLGAEDSAFPRLFEWVEARKELVGEFLLLLGRLPEADLPPMTVVKLLQLATKTGAIVGAQDLLKKWSQSEANPKLAQIAKARLARN